MHIAARVVRGPGQSIALSGFGSLGNGYSTNLDPNLQAQVLAAATAAGNPGPLTVDQWSYYATQVNPALVMPSVEQLGTDRTTQYSIAQWWSMVTNLTGLNLTAAQQAALLNALQLYSVASGGSIPAPTPTPPPVTPPPSGGAGTGTGTGTGSGSGVTNTSQPPPPTTPPPTTPTPTACSFYQTLDPTTNTCGLNYYLVGGVLGVGLLLLMMGKKKGRS